MATIGIQGLMFEIEERYKAGAVTLSEGEGAALQQTFAEAIRNNNAKKVAKAIEDAKAAGKEVDVASLQKQVTEYAATFQFNQTRMIDPVRAMARKLAVDILRKKLRETGVKMKDVSTEDLNARADKLLEQNPAVLDFAKKQVEASRKALANIQV